MTKRTCNYLGCDRPAEFELWDEQERRPDVGATDACIDHVGYLVGSLPPVLPIGPWRLISIKPVIVPSNISADEANKCYGEDYWKDWEYEGESLTPE
jgi:hypothetical protein